jgi:hypothetical protein
MMIGEAASCLQRWRGEATAMAKADLQNKSLRGKPLWREVVPIGVNADSGK